MLTAATAGLLRLAEPAERRLLVLIYHRVLPRPDELFPREITAEVFEWQMRSIAKHLAPLPLAEGIERLASGTLPRRAVAVTFDDGYADNLAVAAPILRGAGVPATFFVATGYLGGGRMWNDTVIEAVRRLPDGEHDFGPLGLSARTVRGVEGRRAFCRDFIASIKHHPYAERQARADQLAAYVGQALPDDLMMAPAQVAELASLGFGIGGHTVSHPILRVLDGPEAAREIAEGRVELERSPRGGLRRPRRRAGATGRFRSRRQHAPWRLREAERSLAAAEVLELGKNADPLARTRAARLPLARLTRNGRIQRDARGIRA